MLLDINANAFSKQTFNNIDEIRNIDFTKHLPSVGHIQGLKLKGGNLKAAHDKGNKWAGLDVFSGNVVDCWETGVIEPLKIKTQAVKSASEVANLILRIDDVIAAGNLDKGNMPMPHPGMGGMPEM